MCIFFICMYQIDGSQINWTVTDALQLEINYTRSTETLMTTISQETLEVPNPSKDERLEPNMGKIKSLKENKNETYVLNVPAIFKGLVWSNSEALNIYFS